MPAIRRAYRRRAEGPPSREDARHPSISHLHGIGGRPRGVFMPGILAFFVPGVSNPMIGMFFVGAQQTNGPGPEVSNVCKT